MQYLYIGKIVNTHGIKGEIRILSKFKYKDKVLKKHFKIYIGKNKQEETINTYRKHKQFDGELFCMYLMGYGVGRFLIESLRVDQLQIGHTGIAATQVVCICIFIGGLIGIIRGRHKNTGNGRPSLS